MKYFIFLIIVSLSLAGYRAGAQLLPPLQPEQDACNAIPVCGGQFFTPYSYRGAGRLIEQSQYAASPGCFGESNSVWLTLTVEKAGTLAFTIVPVNSENDYDFAVFDITGINCNEINGVNRVRCNGSDINSCYNGFTGLSNNTAGTITGPGAGADFIGSINTRPGNVYLILVDNFIYGSKVAGFTIDFSSSTATFVHPKPAALAFATTDQALVTQVTVQLNSKIRCSSIAGDGSDFSISPSVNIIGATGKECRAGGYTSEIVLTLDSPIPQGSYILNAQTGHDGNTLTDFCGSSLLTPDSVIFFAGRPQYTPPAVTTTAKPAEPDLPQFYIPSGPGHRVANTGTVSPGREYVSSTLPGISPSIPEEIPVTTTQPANDPPEPIQQPAIDPPQRALPATTPEPEPPTLPEHDPANWNMVENTTVVSTVKNSATKYQMTWKFVVPELVGPTKKVDTHPIPKPTAVVQAQPKPAVVTPPVETPKPVVVAPPVVVPKPALTPAPVPNTARNTEPIAREAFRTRKISYTGVIFSPKYTLARRIRPRIPELDNLTPKPVIVHQQEPTPEPVIASVPAPVTQPAELPETVDVVIPEYFSPNGDGIDELFKPQDIKFLRMVEFTVTDKLGQELFSSSNNAAAWNGQYKGQIQPPAIYQYVIRLAWPDGRIETHKGNVELLH